MFLFVWLACLFFFFFLVAFPTLDFFLCQCLSSALQRAVVKVKNIEQFDVFGMEQIDKCTMDAVTWHGRRSSKTAKVHHAPKIVSLHSLFFEYFLSSNLIYAIFSCNFFKFQLCFSFDYYYFFRFLLFSKKKKVHCKDSSRYCTNVLSMGLCKLHRYQQKCCRSCRLKYKATNNTQ